MISSYTITPHNHEKERFYLATYIFKDVKLKTRFCGFGHVCSCHDLFMQPCETKVNPLFMTLMLPNHSPSPFPLHVLAACVVIPMHFVLGCQCLDLGPGSTSWICG